MGIRSTARATFDLLAATVRPIFDAETHGIGARSGEIAAAMTDPLFMPSKFWQGLNASHLHEIAAAGIRSFKRRINHNYYGWTIDRAGSPLLRALEKLYPEIAARTPQPLNASGLTMPGGSRRLHTAAASDIYARFLSLLWHHASRNRQALAADLREPALGAPITIDVGGRPVSQDLANSLREYGRLAPYLDGARPVLAEVGAGYGRLGYVALQARPLRYWIFDVPPALAISEWYLPKVLPRLKVHRWRQFEQWEDVAAEVETADVAFFSSDQLLLVPNGLITAFAAISALHEMKPELIRALMHQMGRKTTAAIYTKNFTAWHNKPDDFRFESAMIVPPDGWSVKFDRVDPIVPSFTEKLYVR